MREIKFRAWDKTRQIMFVPIGYSYIDGYLTCISEAKRTMQNDVTEHLDETWYEDYREPRYSDGKSEIILMQFTGLKDKNGKEIYEGDIVNYGNYTDNDKPCNEEIIFENCSFVGREIRKFGDKNAVSMIGKDCEVIGNIYENPELLKQIKNEFLKTSTIGKHTIDVFENFVNGLDLFDETYKDI